MFTNYLVLLKNWTKTFWNIYGYLLLRYVLKRFKIHFTLELFKLYHLCYWYLEFGNLISNLSIRTYISSHKPLYFFEIQYKSIKTKALLTNISSTYLILLKAKIIPLFL